MEKPSNKNKPGDCIGIFSLLLLILSLLCVLFLLLQYFSYNTGDAAANTEESCMTDKLPYCNVSDDIQFQKFIHLGVDGVSWEFIDLLRQNLANHSHEFIAYTDQIRYTSELLKTWFSGRDNDKMNVRHIDGESFFSVHRRKYGRTIHLYGSLGDFNNVLAYPFQDKFWKVTDHVDEQPLEKHRPYSFWLAPENQSVFIDQLNTWNENGISLVSFTADTDHVQHSEASLPNV